MYKVMYIFLIIIGLASMYGGIWVALHLKHLPSYPVWIGLFFISLLVLKSGMMLAEIIQEGE